MKNNNLDHNEDFQNSGKRKRKNSKKTNVYSRPTKIPKTDKASAGDNPFKKHLRIPVTPSTDRFQLLDEDDKLFSKSIYIATEEQKARVFAGDFRPFLIENGYIRLFTNTGLKEIMLSFKASTNTLLLYILLRVENGSDLFLINKQHLVDRLKLFSKDTLYNAINELIDKGVIAKSSEKHHYWINPGFFFNGSRPNLFPENVYHKTKEGSSLDYTTLKELFQRKAIALDRR